MPRKPRHAPGGYVYHVLNRGVGRRPLFLKPEDYAAFERVMSESHARTPIPILAYCLMPNHWHFVLQPRDDTQRLLSPWPVERPADWLDFVNEPQTSDELAALRRSVNRGAPFGSDDWQAPTVEELGLESTLRPRGRPRKEESDALEDEDEWSVVGK